MAPVLRPLVALSVIFSVACSSTDDKQTDGGVGGKDSGTTSIACYIAGQFRCKEFPEATADQQTNLPIECSSTSGVLSSPASCPTARFAGKCTMGTGVGREIKRVYTGPGVDVAYEQDFCVNTAKGVWSTTF